MPKCFQNDAEMYPEGGSSEEGGHSYFLLPFRIATSHVFLGQRLQRRNVTNTHTLLRLSSEFSTQSTKSQAPLQRNSH